MKRRTSFLGLIGAIALLLQAPSSRAQDARLADFWKVDAGGSTLNIRAAPSTNAGILTRFRTNTVLRNLGCRSTEGRTWCAIEQPVRDGIRGWAAGEYLREAAPPTTRAWAGDPLVSGTPLGATERVACAIVPDAPTVACEFGVVRGGTGTALLLVQLPDGSRRTIQFDRGLPISTDAHTVLFASWRDGDVTKLAIGTGERYVIPDRVVDGS